jgi:hypothetical protein
LLPATEHQGRTRPGTTTENHQGHLLADLRQPGATWSPMRTSSAPGTTADLGVACLGAHLHQLGAGHRG